MIPAPYPWRCIRLPPGIPCVSYGASQKKVAVSYCFDPILYCPPLAALFDDRREEFSRVGSKG